ncbi:SEC14-like protein 2 [Trichonephila clavipes]|nr:SEC14-like protein 2 [Trichonephila clavipes]
MTKSTRRVKNQPGTKKITVSRKSKVLLELDVKEAGSTIEWGFETECRDIGFGFLYKDSDNNKDPTVELIPKQRIDTHFSSEMGMFLCEKPGKSFCFTIAFDLNTLSNLHSYINITRNPVLFLELIGKRAVSLVSDCCSEKPSHTVRESHPFSTMCRHGKCAVMYARKSEDFLRPFASTQK